MPLFGHLCLADALGRLQGGEKAVETLAPALGAGLSGCTGAIEGGVASSATPSDAVPLRSSAPASMPITMRMAAGYRQPPRRVKADPRTKSLSPDGP